jgi:2-succinyl-5-enolpyruvyl-6-hydroxy-3-cyclohexene-1-carboxylate synthase
MISTKKHIQQLAAILHRKGIEDIVISPGSRNGPLIHTFANREEFHCRSITDERSAGYFALGLAQARQKAVALVCTSGTAALNYAPAVAEAFYRQVPLIILTADRPGYLTDQGENQTIRQKNIYRDFTKKEITLPLGESTKELWYAGRMINEVLNNPVSETAGPVHINIPLEEPLHDLLDAPLPPVRIIEKTGMISRLPEEERKKLAGIFNQSARVLILAGQQPPDASLEKLLGALAEKTGAVILKEHLANLNHPLFCSNPDLLITAIQPEDMAGYRPDLLITTGGMFISKPLRQFLRKNPPRHHWHLSLSHQHADTYKALTRVIATDSRTFFEQLLDTVNTNETDYLKRWKEKEQQVGRIRDAYTMQTDFCDLHVFNQLRQSIPENSVVHLGNSSPVRYALLYDAIRNTEYHGNRGTSGIDGCLSTAVGFASASEKINTVVLGDLSFFYDSNALWNHFVGDNLRIIVIHNGGGNIFSLINGPAHSPAFNEFFFTENRISAKGIAHTFGTDYLKAENAEELQTTLQNLYGPKQKKAAILEVFTDATQNVQAFRELFEEIKKITRDAPDQAGVL